MSEDRKKTLESQFWGTDNINEELNEINKEIIDFCDKYRNYSTF